VAFSVGLISRVVLNGCAGTVVLYVGLKENRVWLKLLVRLVNAPFLEKLGFIVPFN
jgi:hypothetical protein